MAKLKTDKQRILQIFRRMKNRCYNPKNDSYHNYGARGILICETWLTNSIEFYNWSISNGYSKNLTIDRIEVNANYSPENCRWASRKIQANNRRNNRFVIIEGTKKTVTEWATVNNINKKAAFARIRRGVPDKEAVTRPIKRRSKRKINATTL